MTAPAWSPDQKLRADATSVEIRARFDYLDDHMPEEYEQEIWDEPIVAFYIAHEFAAAKLAVGADAEPTPLTPCADCGAVPTRLNAGGSLIVHRSNCPQQARLFVTASSPFGGAPASGGDTARLDALSEMGCVEIEENLSGQKHWWTIERDTSADRSHFDQLGRGATLREAIDSAMSQSAGSASGEPTP